MTLGIAWGVVVGVVGVGLWLPGQLVAMAREEPGAEQTITGEVVDLACYLGHGEQGPEHRQCAQHCIASGLPVGIKAGEVVYLAVGGEHGPANATLASLAAKQVTVEGTVTERDGIHLLAVKKVTVRGEGLPKAGPAPSGGAQDARGG